ncbi:MAG: roadblock/LC7 domain-containing protein [Ardenticatenaceae bacterium]|nr:roadblock/LC7 domain-containing protein [Anaerolineales bacterium]MCB8923304.1 roadblock/LC7 domain-containing protein [Ardenticatenaceae bacterium]MCB8992044.1 roadblock/LC7 domain-containing protein [Ardenticatenaceae bacterium]MCB9004697.1 roadblock/LC7 domain-containing protein [Ardenticatenaceae bacterium]
MADLNEFPGVQTAVLSTEDGLTMDTVESTPGCNQLAAVAGFMLTTAQLSSTMLGLQDSEELMLQGKDGRFLVCRPFQVGQTRLILSVIFNQTISYKRLFNQTIQAIQQTVEKS